MAAFWTAIALAAFVADLIIAVSAWFAVVIYGYKAIIRARPGVSLWSEGPGNVLLRSELLTPQGLEYRRKCLIAIGVFFVAIAVPPLLAAITGKLRTR